MKVLLEYARTHIIRPGSVMPGQKPRAPFVELWYLLTDESGKALRTPAGRYVEESRGGGKTRNVYRAHSEEAKVLRDLKSAFIVNEWTFELKSQPVPDAPEYCRFFAVSQEEFQIELEVVTK